MGFINQNFSASTDTGISLTALADQSFASSPFIDNNVGNNYVSATIQVTLTAGTGGNPLGSVICYIVRSVDDSTLDTIDDNLQVLGVFNVDGNAGLTYVFSMDTAPTGTLPVAWGLAVFNNTGSALASGTAAYCGKQYFAF
jgi:hypothetical protein